jgi:hypothetical protein
MVARKREDDNRSTKIWPTLDHELIEREAPARFDLLRRAPWMPARRSRPPRLNTARRRWDQAPWRHIAKCHMGTPTTRQTRTRSRSKFIYSPRCTTITMPADITVGEDPEWAGISHETLKGRAAETERSALPMWQSYSGRPI